MNELTDAEVLRLRALLVAAREELDALKVDLVRERSINQALRAGHPSARIDDCPPHGIKRPKLTVVR
jgi:hypothetical protein